MDITVEQMLCVPAGGVTTINVKREGKRVKVVTHRRMLNALMVLVTAPFDMEPISVANQQTSAMLGMEDVQLVIITVAIMEAGLDEKMES